MYMTVLFTVFKINGWFRALGFVLPIRKHSLDLLIHSQILFSNTKMALYLLSASCTWFWEFIIFNRIRWSIIIILQTFGNCLLSFPSFSCITCFSFLDLGNYLTNSTLLSIVKKIKFLFQEFSSNHSISCKGTTFMALKIKNS